MYTRDFTVLFNMEFGSFSICFFSDLIRFETHFSSTYFKNPKYVRTHKPVIIQIYNNYFYSLFFLFAMNRIYCAYLDRNRMRLTAHSAPFNRWELRNAGAHRIFSQLWKTQSYESISDRECECEHLSPKFGFFLTNMAQTILELLVNSPDHRKHSSPS